MFHADLVRTKRVSCIQHTHVRLPSSLTVQSTKIFKQMVQTVGGQNGQVEILLDEHLMQKRIFGTKVGDNKLDADDT